MKTFLIAFALGVFTGAAVTAYFTSPETFQKMKADKARLLDETPVLTETLEVVPPEPDLPAAEPEVAVEPAKPEPPAAETPKPAIKKPAPVAKPPAKESIPAAPEPTKSEPVTPIPAPVAEPAPEPAPKSVPPDAKPNAMDSKIATAIRAQFKLDDTIRDLAIEIDVKDRVVTLTGSAPDSELALHIIEVAAATKGVLEVESKNLSVAP